MNANNCVRNLSEKIYIMTDAKLDGKVAFTNVHVYFRGSFILCIFTICAIVRGVVQVP